ncbi:MAG: hypothetical protein WC209_07240 [Ignavibacteriaceae bacterium]|jgi:hypothetical protein
MSWDIKLITEPKIIKLIYSGTVTPDQLKEALTSCVTLAKKENILRFIADTIPLVDGHSVFDLYAVIQLYETIGFDQRMKEAVIVQVDSPALEVASFYETACLNRGYNVKIFSNESEAITWLSN